MGSRAIVIESLYKSFRDETVLEDVNLVVEEGEFCVIVGPSGCGKSTLLKCIAGLHDVDSGVIKLNGEDADRLSVQERDIGYVFQEFEETLFPHMTVGENIAFGLEQRDDSLSGEEIQRRIDETLVLLAIEDTVDSVPKELSGGQQQRVELGRQLVRECEIMLLDDPLADLDYKLQKRMELEMRQIHHSLGSTFLYVTHNQDQALKLADKLVVMNEGVIEQIGTPKDVYHNPETAFVGRFIGDSNALVGDVVGETNGHVEVKTALGSIEATRGSGSGSSTNGILLIRPERISIGDDARGSENVVSATLSGRTYTGETTEYSFSFDGYDSEMYVVEPGEPSIDVGTDEIDLGWDIEDGVFHDKLSVPGTMTLDGLLEV